MSFLSKSCSLKLCLHIRIVTIMAITASTPHHTEGEMAEEEGLVTKVVEMAERDTSIVNSQATVSLYKFVDQQLFGQNSTQLTILANHSTAR